MKPKNENKSLLHDLFGQKKLSGLAAIVPALVLMIVAQCVVIGINGESFFGIFPALGRSWLNILRNNVYTGVLALGMCFVIVSGGIDLSVGSMVCAVGAVLMHLIDEGSGLLPAIGIKGPLSYIIAILLSLAFGLFLGEINGALVAYGKIPPFIVTLGTMKIYRSVTQQLNTTYNPTVPDGFKKIATLPIGGQVVLPIFYWIAVVAVLTVVFGKTTFGKNVIAVGSNERAAWYSAVNVKTVKRRVYALSGLLAAVAGILYVARIGTMDFANAGSGFEMNAVAGAVVGGTAMAGGRGSVVGAFLGMLVIGAMDNVLNMLGVPTFLCDAIRGAIIIVAVLVQRRDKKDA